MVDRSRRYVTNDSPRAIFEFAVKIRNSTAREEIVVKEATDKFQIKVLNYYYY